MLEVDLETKKLFASYQDNIKTLILALLDKFKGFC